MGNLPIYTDENGTVWSCWSVSEEETRQIAELGCVFIGLVRPPVFPVMMASAPATIDHG